MKKEELFELMKDIDPESVKKAREYKGKKKVVLKRWLAVAACFAVIIGAIYGVPAIWNNDGGAMTVMAAYPEPVAKDMSVREYMSSEESRDWWDKKIEQISKSKSLQDGMADYNMKMMKQLLVSEKENTVCSPLNTYIALSMLAEISGGNTRKQIMDALGVQDIGKLRENITALWECNYADTPMLKSILSNSLWLSDKEKYKDSTREILAKSYYASSFKGRMGSEEMNEKLRKWADDSTCGILKEYTKGMSTDQNTLLEILSTIYYKAQWSEEFIKEENVQDTFHGVNGDTTVDMMKRDKRMKVYKTDKFTSVGLHLNDSGAMYFLLPEENVDVNSLPTDPDILEATKENEEGPNWISPIVHMSVPKFKVSNKIDMLKAIQKCGIIDATDPKQADFSPLVRWNSKVHLDKVEHAAMVEIDEEGVTAAAYTDLELVGAAPDPEDEIDFVLNRPFMFMITGSDGSILFSGIMRNIES